MYFGDIAPAVQLDQRYFGMRSQFVYIHYGTFVTNLKHDDRFQVASFQNDHGSALRPSENM